MPAGLVEGAWQGAGVATMEDRLDRVAIIVREWGSASPAWRGGWCPMSRPAALMTDERAAEIAARTGALAQLLTDEDPSRNHFAGVYGELYRRFGVSSYNNIRRARYGEVLDFLEEWRARVAGD